MFSAAQSQQIRADAPQPPVAVQAALRHASRSTGVDFSYLTAKASLESGFRTDAQAPTSSARGLFQFTRGTWLETVRDHGARHGLEREAALLQSGEATPAERQAILALRDDPAHAANMAAEFAKGNQEHLERNLDRPIGATDLYLAHFLGAGGAVRFLEEMEAKPDMAARDILPKAAAANRWIFYDHGQPRSLAQVYDLFETKMARAGADVDTVMPVAEGGFQLAGGSVEEKKIGAQLPGMAPRLSLTTQLMLARLSLPGEADV